MEERGYTVISLLGQGGQGRVYEVRNGQGTVCVLKQLLLSEGYREKTLQEVRLLASLRHPCIVPYLDSFTARSMPSMPAEDVLCLVMQRCERDLRQEVVMRQPQELKLPEGQVLSWLTQLCWGLQHLHARRFLHRDLKPQNVLLARADGAAKVIADRVLLADFGMAGHLECTEDFKSSIVGTPSYMSPEMLEGRPYDFKTDQWALGCVLFEMMALRAPFADCQSYAAVVVAVLQSAQLQAPAGYSCELSGALEGLLARQPENRPTNPQLLSGTVLRPSFQAMLRAIAEEVYEKSPSRPHSSAAMLFPEMPVEAESYGSALHDPHHTSSYGSDFESYSGSEDPSSPHGGSDSVNALIYALAEEPGSVNADSWTRVLAEAEALLDSGTEADVPGRMMKLRTILGNMLGTQAQVDRGICFLRERRPLGDSAEDDEMMLQIEIVDVLGENALHALPLLERYLVLEAQCT